MLTEVWLVEDEAAIADSLLYKLHQDGFQTQWFNRGQLLLDALQSAYPELLILDIGLPDINGFELCKRVLAIYPDLAIIFLTARNEELDRIIGLEIGADDYIAKPFSPREVSARVRTILRRLGRQQRQLADNSVLHIDESAAIITFYGVAMFLTRYEYLLLKTLIKSPNRIFSRQQLMDLVWVDGEESLERTVDTHIKTLRSKMRQINPDVNPIQTHRGMGYSLSMEKCA